MPMTEDRDDPSLESAAPAGLLGTLDQERSTAYVIDREGRIVFVNPAWDEFATANGGQLHPSILGTSLWRVVPPILLPFWQAGIGKALSSGEPWEHDYECSSDLVARKFRMRVLPMAGRAFAIVTNDLIVEEPKADSQEVSGARYLTSDGIVTQCAHCRRVLRQDAGLEWDWVPSFVRSPPARVSHGLCPPCLEFFYPADGA